MKEYYVNVSKKQCLRLRTIILTYNFIFYEEVAHISDNLHTNFPIKKHIAYNHSNFVVEVVTVISVATNRSGIKDFVVWQN